ncbi:hypothetical protein FHR87_000858 [Azomonas macrocytogenes]|uniref:Uncharacterized protein n=1 Tax=Azomonas macrocytogenes TaxID=69962 RepID=A0A839T3D3_AZOMA|nr:hypothetical protein [Azomonas macrocytogenes]
MIKDCFDRSVSNISNHRWHGLISVFNILEVFKEALTALLRILLVMESHR